MILLILLMCIATTIADPEKSYTEEDALNFIKESSEDFYDFFDTLSIITFTSNDNGNFHEILQKLNVLESAAKNLTILAKKAENYQYENFKNEHIKLGIRNIRMSPYLYVLGDEYFNKLLPSIQYFKQLGTDPDICNFKETDKCEKAFIPDISNIISKSNDESELKYYWREWRDRNSKFGPDHLQTFVDLFKKAADLTETKPLDLWYRIYMDSNFMEEMEKVMKEIQTFYKKIHSYIRYQLNKNYGDKVVPKNGPIPYHLFEKVLVQNWLRNVIELPHPDYQLPDFDTRIKKMIENSDKTLLNIATEFYESMGIEDIDEVFNEKEEDFADHIKYLNEKSDEGDTCKAKIYAESTYYYLKVCPNINFRKYLQHHGWISPIYFVQQKSSLPYANFQSYNFEIPSGKAAILSASSLKHLSVVGLLTDQENDNDNLVNNRLFKMGVHTMLNIPIFFVHSKVMNDLLSGEVIVENVNEYYWKLMKQYAGVGPPLKRTNESFDFSYNFYEDLEYNHQTTKFVSEILGYQIYSSLCKKSEIIQPALHNCDLHKSQKTGETLKKFMKIGSTKSWRKSISIITGDESGLSGKPILEYYQPITIWLNEIIDGNSIPVGW